MVRAWQGPSKQERVCSASVMKDGGVQLLPLRTAQVPNVPQAAHCENS